MSQIRTPRGWIFRRVSDGDVPEDLRARRILTVDVCRMCYPYGVGSRFIRGPLVAAAASASGGISGQASCGASPAGDSATWEVGTWERRTASRPVATSLDPRAVQMGQSPRGRTPSSEGLPPPVPDRKASRLGPAVALGRPPRVRHRPGRMCRGRSRSQSPRPLVRPRVEEPWPCRLGRVAVPGRVAHTQCLLGTHRKRGRAPAPSQRPPQSGGKADQRRRGWRAAWTRARHGPRRRLAVRHARGHRCRLTLRAGVTASRQPSRRVRRLSWRRNPSGPSRPLLRPSAQLRLERRHRARLVRRRRLPVRRHPWRPKRDPQSHRISTAAGVMVRRTRVPQPGPRRKPPRAPCRLTVPCRPQRSRMALRQPAFPIQRPSARPRLERTRMKPSCRV